MDILTLLFQFITQTPNPRLRSILHRSAHSIKRYTLLVTHNATFTPETRHVRQEHGVDIHAACGQKLQALETDAHPLVSSGSGSAKHELHAQENGELYKKDHNMLDMIDSDTPSVCLAYFKSADLSKPTDRTQKDDLV